MGSMETHDSSTGGNDLVAIVWCSSRTQKGKGENNIFIQEKKSPNFTVICVVK